MAAAAGSIGDGSGYFNDYSNNANCKWLIAPRGASWVSVSFSEFSTEATNDVVRVFQCTDASCEVTTKLAELSGTYATTQTFTSATPYMALWFTSDVSGQSSGFTANWASNIPTPPVRNKKYVKFE